MYRSSYMLNKKCKMTLENLNKIYVSWLYLHTSLYFQSKTLLLALFLCMSEGHQNAGFVHAYQNRNGPLLLLKSF